ncbi:VWA domain-containing protein [Virgisporangium aurantiacum]|uniref:VWA domain-containing protein n=1 Tax=Virgisporangium aurantiacum TaxID=175570 RepID=A0A8J4EAD4_9ACTN|nr:substrate-binding domain-containing protein [Virgisporangium aurantiacum]GIJ64662.1 VWA domain-containing protein [Virgisporangium aurantiacum]
MIPAPRRASALAASHAIAMLAVATLLVACDAGQRARPDPTASTTLAAGSPVTLRVLAGSELADMRPILDEAARATAVTVKMDFAGSIEGAETVASGKADGVYDAVWFSSNRYLDTIPAAKQRLAGADRIMTSPVVLGLRTATAQRLGWAGTPVSWAQIASAAAAGTFTFAMTDPTTSNSGFSALVAVATALDDTGRALDAAAVSRVSGPLTGFFRAQQLTAGSSAGLTDAFVRRMTGADLGPAVDGLINYEGSLVELNRSGRLPESLTLIYPRDGVVSGDYPLTQLASASTAARDAQRRLADYLRSESAQRRIGQLTTRRPAVAGLQHPADLGELPVELPFPEDPSSVKTLLTAYLDKLRRPSRTVYVLDVSGSMRGPRLDNLKSALNSLTGTNSAPPTDHCRFRSREEVLLLPFSDRPAPLRTFTLDPVDPQPSHDLLRTAIADLRASGATAVYDSLVAAYTVLDEAVDKDRFVSIVLMTDGESNRGRDLAAFKSYLQSRGSRQPVAVFPILFGEADEAQMRDVAAASGGAMWDARAGNLTTVFCQIRGYQ